MRVLGIETSTMMGSVAVVDEQGLQGERRWETETGPAYRTGRHAERLMEELDRLLTRLKISIQEMDGFSVTIGPGSFTGLRVGLATVKGLAFVTHRPVIPISTLEALARNLPDPSHPACLPDRLVCALLDARRDEVYAALFRRDEKGRWARLMPDQVISPGELVKQLSGPTIFLGEGAARYQAFIQEALGERASFAPSDCQWPSASIVAELGLTRLLQGERVPAEKVVPAYLRRPDAEINREKGRLAAGVKHKVKIERS